MQLIEGFCPNVLNQCYVANIRIKPSVLLNKDKYSIIASGSVEDKDNSFCLRYNSQNRNLEFFMGDSSKVFLHVKLKVDESKQHLSSYFDIKVVRTPEYIFVSFGQACKKVKLPEFDGKFFTHCSNIIFKTGFCDVFTFRYFESSEYFHVVDYLGSSFKADIVIKDNGIDIYKKYLRFLIEIGYFDLVRSLIYGKGSRFGDAKFQLDIFNFLYECNGLPYYDRIFSLISAAYRVLELCSIDHSLEYIEIFESLDFMKLKENSLIVTDNENPKNAGIRTCDTHLYVSSATVLLHLNILVGRFDDSIAIGKDVFEYFIANKTNLNQNWFLSCTNFSRIMLIYSILYYFKFNSNSIFKECYNLSRESFSYALIKSKKIKIVTSLEFIDNARNNCYLYDLSISDNLCSDRLIQLALFATRKTSKKSRKKIEIFFRSCCELK